MSPNHIALCPNNAGLCFFETEDEARKKRGGEPYFPKLKYSYNWQNCLSTEFNLQYSILKGQYHKTREN